MQTPSVLNFAPEDAMFGILGLFFFLCSVKRLKKTNCVVVQARDVQKNFLVRRHDIVSDVFGKTLVVNVAVL